MKKYISCIYYVLLRSGLLCRNLRKDAEGLQQHLKVTDMILMMSIMIVLVAFFGSIT